MILYEFYGSLVDILEEIEKEKAQQSIITTKTIIKIIKNYKSS